MNRRGQINTKKIVYLAILTALVIALQFVSNITGAALPVPITLTLVPIVLSAALCDWFSGVWLGAVFGITVMLTGASEPFFTWNPFGTIVTVMVKGMLAGLAAGLIYKLLENRNRYLAILLSGFAAPIVNTGIFILGCYLFFYESVAALAGGEHVFKFIIFAFAGINFLIELLINVILAPTILRLVNYKKAENR